MRLAYKSANFAASTQKYKHSGRFGTWKARGQQSHLVDWHPCLQQHVHINFEAEKMLKNSDSRGSSRSAVVMSLI
jgi:hypothetical protein